MFARLFDVARAALLLAALSAGAVAWLFVSWPAVLARYDAALVADHEGPSQRQLAALAAQADPRVGVVELLRSLAAVRKADRLAGSKRAAYQLGVSAHLRAGDAAGANALAEAWANFDPLDLDARAAQARALEQAGRPDALAIWRELFAFASDRDHFAAPIIEAALARRDERDAAATLFALLTAGGMPPDGDGGWLAAGFALTADLGQGFDPTQRQALTVERDGEHIRVPFTPPTGARRLRLGLPPLAMLTLDDVGVRIVSGDHDVELPLGQLARSSGAAVSVLGCVADEKRLTLTGDPAPSLAWSLGGSLALDLRFVLQARVVGTPPPWLDRVLATRAAGELGAALREDTRIELADARRRYLAVRTRALQRAGLRVALGGSAPSTQRGEMVGDAVRYSLRLERGDATELRLLLPAIAGVEVAARAPFAPTARWSADANLQAHGQGWSMPGVAGELSLPLAATDPAELTLEVVLR